MARTTAYALLLTVGIFAPTASSCRVADVWMFNSEVTVSPAPTVNFPDRQPGALTGSQFIAQVTPMNFVNRENAIRTQLNAGNIPERLRRLVPVTYTANDSTGTSRTITVYILPDYLGIGTDADWVRMPMSPNIAQTFLETHDLILPTRLIVGHTWTAADEKLEHIPMEEPRTTPPRFLEHHNLIEAARTGNPPIDSLISGIKKDVVISNRLLEQSNRVAIYGWYRPNGTPIQPLSIVHSDTYVDYSQGLRPIHRRLQVDGEWRFFEDVASDPVLWRVVSDEAAPLTVFGYPPR